MVKKMKVLLSTVWHTGSESMRAILSEADHNVTFCHCDGEGLNKARDQQWDRIVTTYRDPAYTLASWANRYDMFDPYYQYWWRACWAGWSSLIRMDDKVEIFHTDNLSIRLNEAPDPKGLKGMADRADWEQFEHHCPIRLLDFAEDMRATVSERVFP